MQSVKDDLFCFVFWHVELFCSHIKLSEGLLSIFVLFQIQVRGKRLGKEITQVK